MKFSRLVKVHPTVAVEIIDDESINLSEFPSPSVSIGSNQPSHYSDNENNNAWSRQDTDVTSTRWKFIEVFVLSQGNYFGFESNTRHAWYLSRNLVDLISSSSRFLTNYYACQCSFVRSFFVFVFSSENSISTVGFIRSDDF